MWNTRAASWEAAREFTNEPTSNQATNRRNAMRSIGSMFAVLAISFASLTTTQAQDPLPSWNDGPAKQSVVNFVKVTTTEGGSQFVPPEERVATFDQDGTLLFGSSIRCIRR